MFKYTAYVSCFIDLLSYNFNRNFVFKNVFKLKFGATEIKTENYGTGRY